MKQATREWVAKAEEDFLWKLPRRRSENPRPEATDDLFWGANADLNVIELAETCSGVKFTTFDKEASHGVKWFLTFDKTKLMERLDNRTVQIALAEIWSAVPRKR